MINLHGQNVLVLGASSMLGKAIIPILKNRGANVFPAYRDDYDLLTQTYSCFWEAQPDYVIHLAGVNGNVQMNLDKPATIFYKTSMINLNVLNACLHRKIKKIVSIIASCAYPDGIDVITENDLWRGPCNYTVECHGTAKRLLDSYSRFLRKEHNLNAITVALNNCFGPYDNFNSKGKVVSQFIKKYVNAKLHNEPTVTNWGDGSPKRELTYCFDAAEAIIQTLEKYEEAVPLNISSGCEVTIKELAEKVSKYVEFEGQTNWDITKANGQMRKKLDTTRMNQFLNVKFTDFDLALKETILWYQNNKEEADNKPIKW